MAKKILIIGDESCEPCRKASPIVKKFAEDKGIDFEIVTDLNKVKEFEDGEKVLQTLTVIPTICAVEDNKIKRCTVGYTDDLYNTLEGLL